MAHPWPTESSGHPWKRKIDPAYYTDAPKATGATAGAAGINGTWTPAGSAAPNTLTEMTGVTANPATVWTSGQRMMLADNSLAHWNGTAWVAGAKP